MYIKLACETMCSYVYRNCENVNAYANTAVYNQWNGTLEWSTGMKYCKPGAAQRCNGIGSSRERSVRGRGTDV